MPFDTNFILVIASICVAFVTIVSISVSTFKGLFSKRDKKKIASLEDEVKAAEVEKCEAEAEATQAKSDNSLLKGFVDLAKVVIPNAIEVAEKSGITTGEAKLAFALSKISLWCVENGLNFNVMKDEILQQLESLISFSKQVNGRKEG